MQAHDGAEGRLLARPAAMSPGSREVRSEIVSERSLPGGRRIALVLEDGERIPALLLLPDSPRPVPAALLLHGLTSHKEQMAESVGRALLAEGVASLAIDLPLHGEREGSLESLDVGNPLELVRRWRLAIDDCGLALRWLAAQRDVEPDRLAIVGYSLGSYVGAVVAAGRAEVRALVVAAGGDLPARTPLVALVRAVADPLRAVRRLAGRPLLVVHGRRDRTVLPEQAERLFAAAGEPKTIRWWDAGHWLPVAAIADAARWLALALGAGRSASSSDVARETPAPRRRAAHGSRRPEGR
jgi:uncharacterized protein